MAIQASGIISGLDTANLIKASMAYDRQPLERAQKQLSTTESKISSLGQVKSAIASLQEAAKGISDSSKLYSYKGSLSNADLASVTTSGQAAAGTYKINVTKLATSHKLATTGPIDTSSGGSLKIEINGKKSDISIAAGASLTDIAKSINSSDAAVSATVVNGQNGPQLVLTSNESGTDNAIKLTSSDISGLNFDPAQPSANSSMSQIAVAENAKVSIDGITLAGTSSNTITDAVTGVTLTLKSTGESQLTVSNDSAAFEAKVKTFVDAYNKVRSTVAGLSGYDPAGKNTGVFNGDGALRSATDQLRGLLSTVPAGASANDAFSTLAVLGIESSATGVLSINSTKLKSAMETDFASVTKTVAAYGSAFDKLTTQMNGTDGLISSKLDGLNSTKSRLNDTISTQEKRMVIVQARYEKQFANLEGLMAQMNSTSNYLSSSLSSLANLR
ncbi:flagellar hook-associated protein 2 [Betaproteobacteria bacterium]|nr:flagellar hook-associated protein 2 [Betaproteobacteria bacterium]